jgi:hypothetical protein
MNISIMRRINALERKWPTAFQGRKAIAERAFCGLDKQEKVQFLSAVGAEREGREFTEAECAAKQSYLRALAQECRKAGFAYIPRFEYAFDLGSLIVNSALERLGLEDLTLIEWELEARKAGEEPTAEQCAGSQRFEAYRKQLADLCCGLRSAADLAKDIDNDPVAPMSQQTVDEQKPEPAVSQQTEPAAHRETKPTYSWCKDWNEEGRS